MANPGTFVPLVGFFAHPEQQQQKSKIYKYPVDPVDLVTTEPGHVAVDLVEPQSARNAHGVRDDREQVCDNGRE